MRVKCVKPPERQIQKSMRKQDWGNSLRQGKLAGLVLRYLDKTTMKDPLSCNHNNEGRLIECLVMCVTISSICGINIMEASINLASTSRAGLKNSSYSSEGKTKVFKYGRRSPWVQTLYGCFQTFKWMPALDWTQKILRIIVQNQWTASPEFFSCIRTQQLFSCLYLYGLFTKVVHTRETRENNPFTSLYYTFLIHFCISHLVCDLINYGVCLKSDRICLKQSSLTT